MSDSPPSTSDDLKLRRRLRLFGLAAMATSALGFLAILGVGNNLVYYWGPTAVLEAGSKAFGPTIRLGGQVVEGSLRTREGATSLDFFVTDGTTALPVHARGLPPPMFREGIGVVVEGTYSRDGVFEGTRLMVSHGNEYRAPEPGESVDIGKAIRTTEGLE